MSLDLLKTNTFAVNQKQLDITKEQEHLLIQKACQIAKLARDEAYEEGRTTPVFLTADIGPIPQQGDCSEGELLLQYQQILMMHKDRLLRKREKEQVW